MVRTCSGLENDNGNQPEPKCMIEHALGVVPTVEPITMAGVQFLIEAMLAEKMKETRQLFQGKRREVTALILEHVLDEG